VTQARVAGLEEKLEAALGQLQRRTQQLADAERRNRSLQVHPRCTGVGVARLESAENLSSSADCEMPHTVVSTIGETILRMRRDSTNN
jgi:hypothetical protein